MTHKTSRAGALLGNAPLDERNQDATEALKNLNKALSGRGVELWTDKLKEMLEQDGDALKASLKELVDAGDHIFELVDDLALGFDETEQAKKSKIGNLDEITKYAAGAANSLGLLHTQLTIALNRTKYSA